MTSKQPMKKSGLGKGITSLLGNYDVEEQSVRMPSAQSAGSPTGASSRPQGASASGSTESKNQVVDVLIDSIIVNPHQPRRFFKESELKSLAASISVDGVIQPVTVTKTNVAGKYMLIAGERRLRASKLAGQQKIPVIIREPMTDQEQLRVALIENIQRQDLNVIEEAEAYQALINDFGLTQEQCADKVGKERSTVANTLRMVNLPREVQDDLVEGRMTMGHGRALLSIEDKKIILRARDIIIKKSLNVRQTEDLCKHFKAGGTLSTELKNNKSVADLDYLADGLRAALKTKIKITGNGSKGKIEVSYFTAAELERIMAIMGHKLG